MLKRNGDNELDELQPTKRAKIGPKKERKGGGLKCKRDDEIDQDRSSKRVKTCRKKEGKSRSKKSAQKSASTTHSQGRRGEN